MGTHRGSAFVCRASDCVRAHPLHDKDVPACSRRSVCQALLEYVQVQCHMGVAAGGRQQT